MPQCLQAVASSAFQPSQSRHSQPRASTSSYSISSPASWESRGFAVSRNPRCATTADAAAAEEQADGEGKEERRDQDVHPDHDEDHLGEPGEDRIAPRREGEEHEEGQLHETEDREEEEEPAEQTQARRRARHRPGRERATYKCAALLPRP